MKTQYSLSWW